MEPRQLLSYGSSTIVFLVIGDIVWQGLTALHDYYILVGAAIVSGGLIFLGCLGVIKLIAIYHIEVIGEKKPVRRIRAK